MSSKIALFSIFNICDTGVFYLHKLKKRTMETVELKQIWCYNLRGLYYEAGLEA